MAEIVAYVGEWIEGAGVAAMVIGMVGAIVGWAVSVARREEREHGYQAFRQRLGRAILLGLEFLVAGDIVRTVAIRPTLTTVAVLAVIVVIRTFLSFTLPLEIEGRWPWQQRPVSPSCRAAAAR